MDENIIPAVANIVLNPEDLIALVRYHLETMTLAQVIQNQPMADHHHARMEHFVDALRGTQPQVQQ